MQTTKCLNKTDATLVAQACAKVSGFAELYKRLERKISISGRSLSTLKNYSCHLAHIALHFNCLPTELDEEQIEDYLHLLQKQHNTPSDSYFKHTVYGASASWLALRAPMKPYLLCVALLFEPSLVGC